ncbi:hypothetical protein LIPSTDRAFT_4531 [Lipomyces starkeyi NRRL Y-11557]|uniref:Uncharacterized protein n=1 Tax=Lipomyces starkeyi NRRL Y-11557 TaxID=675824 RepID=A0A1E3Q3B7_LIPST|nr:hypothetical protein LIPSTDRAFT_4531 [Lipomyces starkeyi NRRL Y-11557]
MDKECDVHNGPPEIKKDEELVFSEEDIESSTVPPEQAQTHYMPMAPYSNTSTSTPNTASTISGTCPTPVPSGLYYDFPNASPDIAHLFRYHRKNLTHCHYFVSTDPIQFFEQLLTIAQDGPLIAAYHPSSF